MNRASVAGRWLQSFRRNFNGGRPRIARRCRHCHAWCSSTREAWVHCAGNRPPGRPKIRTRCPRCNRWCDSATYAKRHCARSRRKLGLRR